MGLLNYITFDGINTSDYGVFISGEGTFNAPERRGELVNIPGRNGALFLDEGGFENIEVEYRSFIGSIYNGVFKQRLQDLRMELKSRISYVRLADTYHPDEFRLALYKAGLEVEPHFLNRSGEFTLIFNCKPQRFLIEGTTPQYFQKSGIITNPTPYNSKPLIKVVGTGTVEIQPYKFTVTSNDSELWIDSELLEAYKFVETVENLTDENEVVITDEVGKNIELLIGQTPSNMNPNVIFDNSIYPEIVPGDVPIYINGDIKEVTIIPRWYRI